MHNERLLKTYGEQACNDAWSNAVRVGLRQKIWRKMYDKVSEVNGDSYLKTYYFIVLKDTEYAKEGDELYFVRPNYGYCYLGNGVYSSFGDLDERIGKGELYPKILLNDIDKCDYTKELFALNKTVLSN